jgi:hypothetical protein
LLTREQAAEFCQCSLEILDEWSYLPGFPVIRRNGGHFVRIHRAGLEDWLREFALQTTTPAANGYGAGVARTSRPGRGALRAS